MTRITRIVLVFAGLLVIIAAVSPNISRMLRISQFALLAGDAGLAVLLLIILIWNKRRV